jgi:hypothetical protein
LDRGLYSTVRLAALVIESKIVPKKSATSYLADGSEQPAWP